MKINAFSENIIILLFIYHKCEETSQSVLLDFNFNFFFSFHSLRRHQPAFTHKTSIAIKIYEKKRKENNFIFFFFCCLQQKCLAMKLKKKENIKNK